MSKIIKIIAGPNGSGKTTFADAFIIHAKPSIPFLNPDLIAAGFGPVDFEKASFQAGRVLLKDLKAKIQNGESFSFESTLSGLTYSRILKEAKKQGYQIDIYFIFLNKVSLNIERIDKRVKQGGHFIPSKVVRRRYLRCFDNFWNIYKPLADKWSVLDNSGNKPKLIQDHDSFASVSDEYKVSWIKKFLKGRL